MWSGRASSTALLVAGLRALASLEKEPLIADREALRFLPRGVRGALERVGRGRRPGLVSWLPEAISPGRLQHIALRTRVIDDHLSSRVTAEGQQVVLLGAGFDTRAYRLKALAGARLFEVDHPDTQERKRARSVGLVPLVAELFLVPVDFEREGLAAGLVGAGFDAGRPSIFVWEGVTMYLTRGAIRATLATLGALMAEGSHLIVTTYDRSGASGPLSRSTAALAALLGERLRTYLSPREASALLAEFAFSVEEDSGRDDWARAHARVPRGAAPERVIVARRG